MYVCVCVCIYIYRIIIKNAHIYRIIIKNAHSRILQQSQGHDSRRDAQCSVQKTLQRLRWRKRLGGGKDEEEEKNEVPVFVFRKEERREGRVVV